MKCIACSHTKVMTNNDAITIVSLPRRESIIKTRVAPIKPAQEARDKVNNKAGKAKNKTTASIILVFFWGIFKNKPMVNINITSKYPPNVFGSPCFPSKGAVTRSQPDKRKPQA